jgi:triacylglycerol lipase
MMSDFRNAGYTTNELAAWSYNTAQSNVTTARQLASQVDALLARTGAAAVDIVAHSMGSLNSRYYLKFLGGTAKVDDWVSLGGPNHGTAIAGLCSLVLTSCQEMQLGSAFLNNLNSGDETPGAVRYGAFWSWCDEIINPDSSVLLSGAENVNVGCIEHIYLMYSDSVSQRVRSFVA